MNIERLFEMTYFLLDRKTTTAKEMADHFGVSIRTIFRDIETLELSGVPICTAQGIKGGIFLDPSVMKEGNTLTEEDKNQLLSALDRAHDESEGQAIQRYLGKLSEILQRNTSDAGGVSDIVLTKHGSRGEPEDPVKIISGAISSSFELAFRYFRHEPRLHAMRVYPIKMLYQKNAWLLLGYDTDTQKYALFHILRMTDITVRNKFDARELPTPDETLLLDEKQPRDLIQIELSVEPPMAHLLYDNFAAETISVDQGRYILRTRIPNDDWLNSFLLSFGSYAEVISPKELRESLGNQGLNILKKYFMPS